MSSSGSPPAPGSEEERAAKPSFGNMSEHHWSRARAGTNAESLEYYRERSKAPGVAEGGGARNFYCMACDGVIDAAGGHARCPHCDAALEGVARRYFNWVEIDRPPASDARPLFFLFLLAVLGILVVVLLVYLLA